MSWERWRYDLVCPDCGKTGTAEEAELDGFPFLRAKEKGEQVCWVKASEGFSAIPNHSTSAIRCTACNVLPTITEKAR